MIFNFEVLKKSRNFKFIDLIFLLNVSFFYFSIPRALATIVESMTAYINSDEHFESLQNVLSKMLEESIMTPAELINIRIKGYENLQWNEMNFKEVNKFFNGDVTTAAQTTSTTPAPTTESTTLGSGSLIASFTVIVSFALIKLFL